LSARQGSHSSIERNLEEGNIEFQRGGGVFAEVKGGRGCAEKEIKVRKGDVKGRFVIASLL